MTWRLPGLRTWPKRRVVRVDASFERWPTQGSRLYKRTEVCFSYDTSKTIMGTIVRDDAERPFRTVIRLDDGRFVEGSECQHSPKADAQDQE